jgi:hypothetical protein
MYVEDAYEFSGLYINNIWTCDDDLVFEQFTGIKDKAGNDIYEGDIVFAVDGNVKMTSKVIRRDFSWCAETPAGNNMFIWYDLYEAFYRIGNINENPELLK